jgi:hypothetical protein
MGNVEKLETLAIKNKKINQFKYKNFLKKNFSKKSNVILNLISTEKISTIIQA